MPLRLAAPGGGSGGAKSAAPPPPKSAPPPPPPPGDDDDDMPPPPNFDDEPPAAAPPPVAAASTPTNRLRGPPPPAARGNPKVNPGDLPAAGKPRLHALPSPGTGGAAAPPSEVTPNQFGRKKSDVTMKMEYEMEVDRRLQVRANKVVPAADIHGDGSFGGGDGGENADEAGSAEASDELAVAKDALEHALHRQETAQSDLRKAKNEFDSGMGVRGSVTSTAPPVAKDVHIRKLDPATLAANAKYRRETMEINKQALRDMQENAIVRGPEVAAVGAAAHAARVQTEAVCGETLAAMEAAVAQLREERDQLAVRLQRVERDMKDDVSRAEGELHWIDFASSEAKMAIDRDAQRKQQQLKKKPQQQQPSKWR